MLLLDGFAVIALDIVLVNVLGLFPQAEFGARQEGSLVVNGGGSDPQSSSLLALGLFHHAVVGTQGVSPEGGFVGLAHVAPNGGGVPLVVHDGCLGPKGRIHVRNTPVWMPTRQHSRSR